MNKFTQFIFNFFHAISIKKPKVTVSFNSIQKYMPEQEKNITDAAQIIYGKNGNRNDSVLIKAIKPNTVEIVVKPKYFWTGNAVKKQVTDLRNMLAQTTLHDKQKESFKNAKSVSKSALNKLNERYFEELEAIRNTPFNFTKAILKTYKKVKSCELI